MWKLISLLGLSFFDLSSNNRKYLLDEIYYLMKYCNISYSDIVSMPSFERKYFLQKLLKEYEEKK